MTYYRVQEEGIFFIVQYSYDKVHWKDWTKTGSLESALNIINGWKNYKVPERKTVWED